MKWCLALELLLAGCAGIQPLMVVNSPVCDLRAEPHTTAQPNTHDPLQETQLLYGERVRLMKAADGWAYVEAVEQDEFTHARRWQGYPGWVPDAKLLPWESLLAPTVVVTEKWAPTFQDAFTKAPSAGRFPLGTYLRATEVGGVLWKVELVDGTIVWMPRSSARALEELSALPPLEKRRAVLRSAALFVGDPYYWGGRSPAWGQTPKLNVQAWGLTPPAVTGVDCSGLVNLAYRSVGLELPRDAHEQFLRARRINALQPADLIFLSERSNPHRIVHVMLYAGNAELIEGPGTGEAVRRIAIAKRLGQPLDWLAPGSVIDEQTVFFGTYLP